MPGRTVKLVFTHIDLKKAQSIQEIKNTFPFEVSIAEENGSITL